MILDRLAGARPKESDTDVDLERNVRRLASRLFIADDAHSAAVGPILLRKQTSEHEYLTGFQ